MFLNNLYLFAIEYQLIGANEDCLGIDFRFIAPDFILLAM